MTLFWKDKVITLLATTVGSLIFSFALNLFIIPANLTSSGMSGMALLIYYVTDIPVGIINAVLNIPVIYAAYRWLGTWQTMMTIIGTLIVSVAIDALHFLSAYQVVHDPIIASMAGGIIAGIGFGIVYRYGGNTGGLDPIALIIRKYYGLQIGSVSFMLNSIIIAMAIYITNVELAIIALINVFLTGELTNRVVMGFSKRKVIFIISDKPHLICDSIIHKLGRSATLLSGEGAYTHDKKEVILTVVSLLQVAKLKNAVNEVDPYAFMFITDTSEVIGQGFSMAIQGPTSLNTKTSKEVADTFTTHSDEYTSSTKETTDHKGDAAISTMKQE